MAVLIPKLRSCLRRMTRGERRFAQRLQALLADDSLCWYDVPIGPRNRRPDFVILHPRRGLLVLEVKDWKLDSIRRIDKHSVELLTSSGLRHAANPLEQARQYTFEVIRRLETDPQLVHPSDHPFGGRLVMPYGHGVVLSRITRAQYESTDLPEVLPPHLVICQDEMSPSAEADAFRQRLWNLFTVRFEHVLSLPQIDRVRWHLFPEVRIEHPSLFTSGAPRYDAVAEQALPDIVRVLDVQQEQLARSLGEGHRVIHGVAGAGKTLVLVHRCAQLARMLPKPILVLCYNRSLAAGLEALLHGKGLNAAVQVRNFHKWCREQLVTYREPLPPDDADHFDNLVEQVAGGLAAGRIPAAQYGAVMIDEGHDFRPEWLQIAVRMVDPATNSLLVLYDDAQSIYGSRPRQFSFASVGVQARGRTTILRLNYRNTRDILDVATRFARELLTAKEAHDDGIPLVMPESAGRRGQRPRLVELPSINAEARHVAGQLRQWQRDGRRWSEMAVLYRQRLVGERIRRELRRADIPFQEMAGKERPHFDTNTVKLLTMHSSKGLEFPAVVIPGLGFMPARGADEKEEARLLYVAITRAMEELVISGHPASPFMRRLRLVSAAAA